MIPLQTSGPVARFIFENSDLGVQLANTIGSAITFFTGFVVLYLAGKAVVLPLVSRVLRRRGLDKHARTPIRKITSILVLFAAIAIAFGAAGYGNFLTSLATIAAAATLAIGFALQAVIKNFVAGVFIYTDKPFRIGDWIEWNDYSGVVEDISLRVTRVRTFDNELLTVPNSDLTTGVIKNPVAKDRLRLQLLFDIGYDDDIDEATEIIIEEAEKHDEILDEPAPSVRLTELGDDGVGLNARIWIADPDRGDFVKIKAEYVQTVKERFDEEGIDIPYPNRTIGGSLDIEGYEAVADD